MGLFNKWNKAQFMDNCNTPFGLMKVIKDAEGKALDLECLYGNPAMAELEKRTKTTIVNVRFSQQHGEEAAREWAEMLSPAANGNTEVKCRRYLETFSILAQITAFPVDQDICGVFLQDYTTFVRRLVKSLSGKEVGIFYYDTAKDIVIADESLQQFFGGPKRYDGMLSAFAMTWIDETYVDLLRAQLAGFPANSGLIEINLKLKNANFIHLALTADVMSDEGTLAIGYIEDVTHAPTFAEQTERDTLTGLFHAVSAKERIDEAIMACYDTGRIDAMILLDLDHFDMVNKRAGYDAGDEMLKKIAEILKNNFKGKDILARPGGDAFIVYVSDLNDKRAALQISRTLNKLVTQTVSGKDGEPVRVTASIGVAFACDNGGNYEKLYQNAEAAMFETKANGRNGYTLA